MCSSSSLELLYLVRTAAVQSVAPCPIRTVCPSPTLNGWDWNRSSYHSLSVCKLLPQDDEIIVNTNTTLMNILNSQIFVV